MLFRILHRNQTSSNVNYLSHTISGFREKQDSMDIHREMQKIFVYVKNMQVPHTLYTILATLVITIYSSRQEE